MKEKISLCAISILFSSAICAGPVQERLEAAYKASMQQKEKLSQINYIAALSPYDKAYEQADEPTKKKLKQKIEQRVKDVAMPFIRCNARTMLLSDLLKCLKIQSQKNPDIAEQMVANKCLDQIISENRKYNETEIDKERNKIFEEELEKIRKKDLRQSWFWWLW